MDLQNELNNLNPEQLDAVKTTDGYVRVIAGAGSGKTKTLTTRCAYLIKNKNVNPDKILCVTFTNKAANEMKQRVTNLVGDFVNPHIMTFHGFCNRFLREEIHAIGWSNRYKIIDTDSDIPAVLKKVYKEYEVTTKSMTYKQAIDRVLGAGCKHSKRNLLSNYETLLENLSGKELAHRASMAQTTAAKILYGYLAEQKKDSLLDYEDLLNLTLYILQSRPQIKEKWQQRFDYMQVDEFQDVSIRELTLVSILSDKCNNLFVVGDEAQSIYGFRGANVDCILDFDEHLSYLKRRKIVSKTIIMNRNYRCTPEILSVSNNLIKYNAKRVDKELLTNRGHGKRVLYYHARNIYDEAQWVANTILSLSYNYKEIAILYRTHSLAKTIEEKLINARIPYRIVSGIGFYQRKEIKDILAILSLVAFEDNLSLQRVIGSFCKGIGQKKLQFLQEKSEEVKTTMYQTLKKYASDKLFAKTDASLLVSFVDTLKLSVHTCPIHQLIDTIITHFDLEQQYKKNEEQQRYENIIELKNSAKRYENNNNEEQVSLEDYLNTITLYTQQDQEDDGDKVTLMTIHAAKGLEFPVVFVIGVNEGVMPISRAKTLDDYEEERRIGYVALTRAKDLLFLSDAEGKNYDHSPKIPSRFLVDMNTELYDFMNNVDEFLLEQALRASQAEALYKQKVITTNKEAAYGW